MTFAEDFIGAIMKFNPKDNPVPAQRYFCVSTGQNTAQMLKERLQKHSLATRSREWVSKEAKSSGDLTLERKYTFFFFAGSPKTQRRGWKLTRVTSSCLASIHSVFKKQDIVFLKYQGLGQTI